MIRFAKETDTAAVIHLWNRCFGDDASFTKWYFANRYCADDTLLYLDGGALCAMVQMLPYQLQRSDDVVAVTYIYGACTAPEFRRRGLMAELLQESFRIDREKGRMASALIPAEPWLFDFYKKFGYETAFSVSNRDLAFNPEVTILGELRPLTEQDCESLDQFYRDSMQSSYFCRSITDWNIQLRMFRDLGGMPLGWYRERDELLGYAFVWKNQEGLWAQELLGQPRELFMQMIMQYCHSASIKATFPGTEQRLGCIRYHDSSLAELGYFNLLFN